MHVFCPQTSLPRNQFKTEELIGKFPCELPENVIQNILKLGVTRRGLIEQSELGTGDETVMNEKELLDLCEQSCQKAIAEAQLCPYDIDCLISAYDANPFLSPGLSQLLVPRLGLDPFVRHVNAQGLASTAFTKTLQLARDYLANNEKHVALVCVSGVSSYWFQNQVRGLTYVKEIGEINSIADSKRKEKELRKWVATMEFFLFGDGVAAAIVSNSGNGLSVGKIVEVTNVNEKDGMAGYSRLSFTNEPFMFGFHSHLGREIPVLGAKYTELALDRLYGKGESSKSKVARKWAVHTGSEKILDKLAEHHGIEDERLKESHEVLNENGNLAGASLPFIINKILTTNKLLKGDSILMLGYGWGFSASAGLLELVG